MIRPFLRYGAVFLLFSLFSVLTAQESRIELRSHSSTILAQTKQFNILFPAGYDSASDRYPVVYLFRGAVDEWADPYEDNSRQGNIKTVYDRLVNQGKIRGMILVMPGLGAPASANEYNYVANELVPYIDASFRTIPTRWHRAMDGFSLGGLITTNLMAGAPHLFASVGSYDGTLSLFDNAKFTSASSSLIYAIKQMQLLYHTASVGGNNHNNNMTTFSILNGRGIVNALPSYTLDPNAQHNWFYADKHMSITLPLHWQKMQNAKNDLGLAFSTPFSGTPVSGTLPVQWTRSPLTGQRPNRLFYSPDDGTSWNAIPLAAATDSSVQWNTLPLKDGTRYRLKVTAGGDTLFGIAVSPRFTVNNPGNTAPDLALLGYTAGDTIAGTHTVEWYAGDADGDVLTITLSTSIDNGNSWTDIAPSVPNNGSYLLNTAALPNSSSFRLRLTCTDGSLTSVSTTPSLVLNNPRQHLRTAFIQRISGSGDPDIRLYLNDPGVQNDADHRITFQIINGTKTYSVFRNNGVQVVTNGGPMDGTAEGPLFDKFRLRITDFSVPVPDPALSGWKPGSTPLTAGVNLVGINSESGPVTAHPYPADYEVRISGSVADTSLALFGAAAMPVNFTVWNVTEGRRARFIFTELDGNGVLSRNDEIYIMEKDSLGAPLLTWHMQFVGNETDPNPVNGNIFFVKIRKPVTPLDTISVKYNPPLSVGTQGPLPGRFALAQNYPNPFNPSTTITVSLPVSAQISLAIYDILGRRVRTLAEERWSAGTHSVVWDASSFPSGVYFCRLRTGSFQQTRTLLLTK
ncbi:MAG: T9SS type A sorting domain-containing protein [Bacteroidetes bacterium]|nr:T9SS type A sorting domain-containing protein [Bacteroidota bacterium]